MYPPPPSMMGVSVQQVPPGSADPCLDPLENQQYVTPWPYYSTVKFVANTAQVAPNPRTYIVPNGTRLRAFAYAQGQTMQVAGYTAEDGVATPAETNLVSANETISGENVLIHGIALQVQASMQHIAPAGVAPGIVRAPDSMLLGELTNSVVVSLGLNGDANLHRLGTVAMIPGAGGLTGSAHDIVGPLQVAGQTDANQGYPANGWAVRSNFFSLPEGLIWRNKGSADSNLNIIFDVVRQITIFSGGSPENNIAGIGGDLAFSNAIGVSSTAQGYLYPAQLVVGFKAFLIGTIVSMRGRSQ